MTRGMPALWSSIVAIPFLALGISLYTGYVEMPIPPRYGIVSFGAGVVVLLVGIYVQAVGASGFEPRPDEIQRGSDYPRSRFAKSKIAIGFPLIGLAVYWLFFTQIPYAKPTLALLLGGFLFTTGIWTYWSNTLTNYYLTNKRLVIERRLFGTHVNDIMFDKVKTTNLHQPFHLRMFGLGNISLDTGASRVAIIRHIAGSEQFSESIATSVQEFRDE